ncbi:MAG: ribosome silencing factor [Bacteroidia bacterium]|nr:ribosome silencing factor [Bacteroidia bacterium]
MKKTLLTAQALSDRAIKGLSEIKGRDIVRMDLRKAGGSFTDFFVICTGTSDRHVQALADSVSKFMQEIGEKPVCLEGYQAGQWILLDYGNIVVHIFQQEIRNFYRLEDFWGDAEFERLGDAA